MLGAYVRLVAATGMRRSEACAIRWTDLDLDARTLNVARSHVALPGIRADQGTKTRSVRSIALDEATVIITDCFADVGLIVRVTWDAVHDSTGRLLRMRPNPTLIGKVNARPGEGFDHDQQAWEVQHDVLGIDPNPGAIQPDGSIKSVPRVTSLNTTK
jgi:hypothetical protein